MFITPDSVTMAEFLTQYKALEHIYDRAKYTSEAAHLMFCWMPQSCKLESDVVLPMKNGITPDDPNEIPSMHLYASGVSIYKRLKEMCGADFRVDMYDTETGELMFSTGWLPRLRTALIRAYVDAILAPILEDTVY